MSLSTPAGKQPKKGELEHLNSTDRRAVESPMQKFAERFRQGFAERRSGCFLILIVESSCRKTVKSTGFVRW